MSGAYASRDTAAAVNRMGFQARRLGPATATAKRTDASRQPRGRRQHRGQHRRHGHAPGVDATERPSSGSTTTATASRRSTTKSASRPCPKSPSDSNTTSNTPPPTESSRGRASPASTRSISGPARVLPSNWPTVTDLRNRSRTTSLYRASSSTTATGRQLPPALPPERAALRLLGAVAERSALVSTASSGTRRPRAGDPRKWASWTSYTGDWALLRATSARRARRPSNCGYARPPNVSALAQVFRPDLLRRGRGGDAPRTGQELLAHAPLLSGPGSVNGSVLPTWRSTVSGRRSCSKPSRQMFNLRFYTEEATREVWIEPEGRPFGAGPDGLERPHGLLAGGRAPRRGLRHPRAADVVLPGG